MKDEISGDLVLRVLNAMTQGDDDGKFLGDELALVTKILASRCNDADQERILAASLAGITRWSRRIWRATGLMVAWRNIAGRRSRCAAF